MKTATVLSLITIATFANATAPMDDSSYMVLMESVTRQNALERSLTDPAASPAHVQADLEMFAMRVARVELSHPGSPCGKTLGMSLTRWWAARRDRGQIAAAEQLQRLTAARTACAASLKKS